MAHQQADRGSIFDPTLSLVTDRMQARHQEAHSERLAALSVVSGTPFRIRIGVALIGLGHALVTPAGAQGASLTD